MKNKKTFWNSTAKNSFRNECVIDATKNKNENLRRGLFSFFVFVFVWINKHVVCLSNASWHAMIPSYYILNEHSFTELWKLLFLQFISCSRWKLWVGVNCSKCDCSTVICSTQILTTARIQLILAKPDSSKWQKKWQLLDSVEQLTLIFLATVKCKSSIFFI